ncbi:MAG: hypothetical protein K1X53_08535 [Candidatus Sumerlaeaceae bacterium]|nr:hypothetical protein [Candidatus Sumerlaeaceae bacterium]
MSVLTTSAAYAGSVVFFGAVAIPEFRRARHNPLWEYNRKLFLKPAFLYGYTLFQVGGALLTLVGSSYRTNSLTATMLVVAAAMNLISFFILFAWIYEPFRRGRGGLFQETILAGAHVQDVLKPFLWMLVLYQAVLDPVLGLLASREVLMQAGFLSGFALVLSGVMYSTALNMAFFSYFARNHGRLRTFINGVFGTGILILGGSALLTRLLTGHWYAGMFAGNSPNAGNTVAVDSGHCTGVVAVLVSLLYYRGYCRTGTEAWLKEFNR